MLKPVLALVSTFAALKLLAAPTLVAFLASGATVLISLTAETSRRVDTLSRG